MFYGSSASALFSRLPQSKSAVTSVMVISVLQLRDLVCPSLGFIAKFSGQSSQGLGKVQCLIFIPFVKGTSMFSGSSASGIFSKLPQSKSMVTSVIIISVLELRDLVCPRLGFIAKFSGQSSQDLGKVQYLLLIYFVNRTSTFSGSSASGLFSRLPRVNLW